MDVGIAALFLLLVLLSLRGAGYQPGQSQLGGEFRDLDWDHVDWNNHLWNLWDFRRVYLGEGSLLHTTSEFFPKGLRTIAAQGDLALKALGGSLALVFSPDTTFLLVGILLFWGNALGGYLLGLTLTGSRPAGLICGLLLCYSSPAAWAANTGNLEYGLWLWLCLYLVFLVRLLRHGRRLDMVLAAALGVLTVLGNFVFFYHLVLASLVLVGVKLRGLGSRRAGRLAFMVFLAAVLLLPVAWSFFRGGEEHNLSFERPTGAGDITWEARVPYKNRALLQDYLPGPWERKREDSGAHFLALGLALLALVGGERRRALPWLGVTLLFLVLSLGPYIAMGGGGTGADSGEVPLPFLLLHRYLPFYHYIRFPHRMSPFVMLPLAVAAAMGAAWLMTRTKGARARIAVSVVLVGAVLVEGNLSWALKVCPRTKVNPFYMKLAQQPGRYGVVELPLDFGILDARYLYFQAYHGKALFNGVGVRYLGTKAIPNWHLVRDNPLLRTAYALQGSHLMAQELSKYIPLELPAAQQTISLGRMRLGAAALKKMGFRHLVLHRRVTFDRHHSLVLPPWSDLERTLRWALGEPAHEDRELMAWEL